ncbi:DUF932 domain-containing protein [Myxococcota bacterium]|nr:DUF932 domain-containing protein [Myxococcota bacterium]MBU1382883.1 DUF932 domain-containing protein [Myxococcota bacterium]MBU1496689.1 DUF932 domain-containing protein [Myxococcota bacterium]
MAHEFETGFFVKEPPWHGLGTVLESAPQTAEEAIICAGLNWEVQKVPLMTISALPVPDNYAVVRSTFDQADVLGVVGSQYEPVQNRDAFAFFDAVISDGHAAYDTAGSLKGGRIVWILAKVDGPLRITKDDYVEKYLLLYNSHDGSCAVSMQFSPIRVVCSNTLAMARTSANEAYKVSLRHTPSVLQRMDSVQTYMGSVNAQFRHTGAAYQYLAGIGINTEILEKYLLDLFPDPKADAQRNRNKAIREKCTELFETGIGTDIAPPSMWRAYNSVTEYVDHVRNNENTEQRVRSAWLGQGMELKQRALQAALEVK